MSDNDGPVEICGQITSNGWDPVTWADVIPGWDMFIGRDEHERER